MRTTNPIETTFATAKHRQRKTKGNGTRLACLTMAFQSMEPAPNEWRIFNGSQIFPHAIGGIPFINGIRKEKIAA